MGIICKKCGGTSSNMESGSPPVCENCKIQLDLLDQQLKVNDERISKLKEHRKRELENPRSENPETHLETMKRLERNLDLEYRKRDGIIKAMNSQTAGF